MILDDPYRIGAQFAPHSEEAEQAVLGSILIEPILLDEVRAMLRPDHFHVERHRLIFASMLSVADADEPKPADSLTVASELERRGKLGAAGGISYLAQLDLNLPDVSRIQFYAEIVRERWAQREVLRVNAEASRLVLSGAMPAEIISRTISNLELIHLGQGGSGYRHISEPVEAIIAGMEGGEPTPGLPTGLPDLDKLLGGLVNKEVYFVAARPGAGKSAFGLGIAEAVAMGPQRLPVGIVSLEMDDIILTMRLLAKRTRIPFPQIARNHLTTEQMAKVIRAAREVAGHEIHIDQTPGQTASEIVSRAKELKRKKDIRLLVVDYIGLIDEEVRSESRTLEIAKIVRRLKYFAQEANIPVVCLYQIGRGPEKENRKPTLGDMAESEAPVRDGYAIMLLWRGRDDRGNFTSEAEVNVAKHRNGETGPVDLAFDGPTMSFRCVSRF